MSDEEPEDSSEGKLEDSSDTAEDELGMSSEEMSMDDEMLSGKVDEKSTLNDSALFGVVVVLYFILLIIFFFFLLSALAAETRSATTTNVRTNLNFIFTGFSTKNYRLLFYVSLLTAQKNKKK